MSIAELELADWRRQVAQLYAVVRADDDRERAHRTWRLGRDQLMSSHPQSPLPPGHVFRESGIPYWPYDATLRFELVVHDVQEEIRLAVPTDGQHITSMRLIGRVELPSPIESSLDVWWLEHYAGGLFVPLRDGTAGTTSYGGGRYALDTAKGADLGATDNRLVLDLNFLYHPSCRYSPQWQCPLAPSGNTITVNIEAGERL